jgi:hypothetical protein
MHQHKLHYDMQTIQVKIASIDIDQIVATKEQVLPALASTVISAKYKGKIQKDINYIASIYAPHTPMLSGMPAIVSIDKNNNCKLVIDNCVPYDICIDRNDVLCLMDMEREQLNLLKIQQFSVTLTNNYQKCPKENCQRIKLLQNCI